MAKWTKVLAGLVDGAWQRLKVAFGNDVDSKDEQTVKFICAQIFPKEVFTPVVSPANAREIMGRNFFGIEEAALHFGIHLTKTNFPQLKYTPFSEATLNECKDSHILVAYPGLSVNDVRRRYKELFGKQDWLNGEKFANIRNQIGRWILVRKTPIKNSFSKTYDEQKALLEYNENNFSACAFVYTMIGHFLSTRERLFEKCAIHTSDMSSKFGERVYVGYLGSDDLTIGNGRFDVRHGDVGLGSVRRYDLSFTEDLRLSLQNE